jgi:hypothetical protein
MEVLIGLATLIITLGLMIWNMSKLHTQCFTNKESLLRAHERIDSLEDTQNIKITELSNEIRSITESQIRMDEKINILLDKRFLNRGGGNNGGYSVRPS